MEPSRRLAAIMFTDIVGYTALMGSNEDKAFEVLKKNQDIHKKLILQFNGTLIKEMGDGMLISFDLASEAVRCAIEIQKASKEQDIPLKIGIHEGEMVFADADVLGDGVNIASRLQENAEKGCIHISSSVYKNVRNKADINTRFVEERTFKNVAEPVKVYKVLRDGEEQIPFATDTKKNNKKYLYYILAGTVIVIAAIMMWNYLPMNSTSAPVEIEKSIAVLPFVNMSNDPEQQYFSDGIMEAILNDLSKIREFKVISRTSVMQYRNTIKTIPQIAEELGVAYLLEGGVQSFDGKVRINAQLINAKQDVNVWSDNYDRELIDIFEVQSDIAQKIASELNTVLSPSEINEIQVRSTSNPEAYNLYMMGRYFWYKRTGDALRKSIDYFEQSLALDPEYALAYSGLADGFLMRVPYDHLPRATGFSKAKEYARRALEINPKLAQAYCHSRNSCQERMAME
jgi:TolB-like protein/class 3 adenylate cyclase